MLMDMKMILFLASLSHQWYDKYYEERIRKSIHHKR